MISLEFLSDTPIASIDVLKESINPTLSFGGNPVEISFMTGALRGDKGDKGAPGVVDDYDPGDLTLVFDNNLI